MRLPFLCEKSGAIALVPQGLMAGWQASWLAGRRNLEMFKINVTGFAKTILNSTLIKLEYKPFKTYVKLYHLTLMFITLYLSQVSL